MSISFSNRFKFLVALVSISLLSVVYFSINSSANELNSKEIDANHTLIKIDLDDSQDLVQPLAVPIELDKPIKHVGFISNGILKQMAERQAKQMAFLDLLSSVLGVPKAADIVISASKAITAGPTKLQEAASSGKNAYVVTVYASGVVPSLSVITYIYYTKQTLRFTYKPSSSK